jgi:LysM repeat protein
MKPVIWLPFSCALILVLNSCTNSGSTAANDPLGTGPFDSQGRYREEWADDPSKWSKPGRRGQPPADDLPFVAKNEQPPANSNPLGPQVASTPPPKKVESTPRETVKRTETPKPVAAKPKPKPTVVKAKPKPKPKTTRYIVKKGDSLSRIASRNGSSVSAIQKANGISGTLIHPGQSLVIPKR